MPGRRLDASCADSVAKTVAWKSAGMLAAGSERRTVGRTIRLTLDLTLEEAKALAEALDSAHFHATPYDTDETVELWRHLRGRLPAFENPADDWKD